MYTYHDPIIGDTVNPAYCNAVSKARVSVLFFGSHCSTTKDLCLYIYMYIYTCILYTCVSIYVCIHIYVFVYIYEYK
jgi:hypothetical protein